MTIPPGANLVEATAGVLISSAPGTAGFICSINSNDPNQIAAWMKDRHVMTKLGMQAYVNALAAGFAAVAGMAEKEGYSSTTELLETLQEAINCFLELGKDGEGKVLYIKSTSSEHTNN